MADGINLWDLAARITADTAQHDRALTESQRKVIALAKEHQALDQKSSSAFKNVGQAAQQLSSHLGGTSSAAGALNREFVRTSLSGEGLKVQLVDLVNGAGLLEHPLILAAAGAAALGVTAYELGSELFKLVQDTAQFGDSVFKAHEKTSLAVGTVSALKIAGHSVGIELETMSTGLIRFVNNLGQAESGNKKLSASFAQMGVTAFRDPDKALSQFITRFAQLKTDEDRTLAASQIFGVRFGANLVEVFNQVGGNLDEFKAKLRDAGMLMTDEGAQAAHQFTVDLNELELQIGGIGRTIGADLMPTARSAIHELDRLVEENRATIIEWTHDFEDAARGAGVVAEYIWKIGGAVTGLSGIPIPPILQMLGMASGLTGIFGALQSIGAASRPAGPSFDAASIKSRFIDPFTPGSTFKVPKSGGGGHGGGDPAASEKRLAELRLKAVLDGLKGEDEANKRSLDRRWEDFDQYAGRFNATEMRRHSAVIQGLKEEMDAAEKIRKPQERLIAIQEIKNKQAEEENTHTKNSNKVLDERAKLLDQLHDFMDQQIRDIGYARSNTDQYDRAVAELEVQLRKAGVTEIEYALAMARTNAQTQRAIDLVKTLTRERRAIAERPRFAEDKNLAHSVGVELDETGATRQRRATQLPDWLYKILPGGDVDEKLHQLASDITNTLDQSIRDGFDKGIKEGFRSMALGFARMLEQMAEQWLASSIFKMLQGIFTPSGGTTTGGQVTSGGGFLGFLKGILPIIGSVLGGSFGGGPKVGPQLPGHVGPVTPFVPHAMGLDYVPFDNYPALLHKGERVMTAQENQRGSGGDLHVHFHVDSVAGAGSRETQRQVAEKVRRLQLHAALQG